VARLIGFADARANFSRLNEIPQRLREHAEQLAALAEEAFADLKAIDEAERVEDGIPALEQRVVEEQQVLDEIDARIAAAEADYQSLLAERAAFATGEDAHTRQAIDYLTNEFRRAEIGELRRDAYTTPYPEDDVIVSQLAQHETEQAQIQQTLEDLKGLLTQYRQRLQELENLRIEFKRKRYDRAGSVFSGDTIVPMLLGQFLSGLLDSRLLWKVLQEQQRYRPRRSNPDFGSGGFGRGSVWRGGLRDLGDIVGKVGRGGFGGLGGGGGFRTGGGF
jgi:DNA repair exonuclease SbcCD ATPase subunit